MAGLPVIVNDAPDMRRVVEQCKIGFVIQGLTFEALKKALDSLNRIKPKIIKENLKRTSEEYCWANQGRAMINAYKHHTVDLK